MTDTPGDGAAPMRRIGLGEFQADMAEILRDARRGGSFLITSQEEVLAEIGPPAPAPRLPRRPGALRGRIRMAEDFDRLPPDLLTAMEGDGN